MRPSKAVSLVIVIFYVLALMTGADAAGVPGPKEQGKKNSPIPGAESQKYTISLTLSDQGQQATIAFDALAFLTGDACSDTFLPPGKVADYAGFQYLRDNDATQMGHNTDFVTRISDNVLSILNDSQLAEFVALSRTEASLSSQYAYMRFPLMKAFRAQLEGDIPAGSDGLNKTAVIKYSAKLYDVDANISLQRAETYVKVIRSLNETQQAHLGKLALSGVRSWPIVDASAALKNSGRAMRTYASEMFSWYTGSVDADVYFCPERQATYFGSFYMKDRPAMGNPGYSISTTLTSDAGENFLNVLNETQRETITSLVDLQRADLNEIVSKRREIAAELRRALAGNNINKTAVRSLAARYGELDGEISYYYATHFAEVGKTVTSEQRQKMIALRSLDNFICEGAYLYSQPISMPQNIPTDFLFGVGSYNSSKMDSWIQSQQQEATTLEPGFGKSIQGRREIAGAGEENAPRADGSDQRKKGPNYGQERRMPPEDIIDQLEQQGYNVSDAKAVLKSGDREAVKAWLDIFRKDNPGVVEAIESSKIKNASTYPNPIEQLGNNAPKNEDTNLISNSTISYDSCIFHTKNNPECKDCCDCLEGNATTRKTCRDACAIQDFSQNTDFIPIRSVSVSGPNGNYSACTASGTEQVCKECCDGSPAIPCGDRRFCRDACMLTLNR